MGIIHQDQMLFPNYEKSPQRIPKTFFFISDMTLFNICIMHKTLRARFGLKTFVLAEYQTGYIFNFKFYTGQLVRELKSNALRIFGSLVLHSSKDLLQKGRTLFLDN
ncbi:hypothetical protein V1478_004412 [Vespula squamosa]|uniref:PiggyBac transposable element-derived protein domain-containing protein n=1 Tax=Vespula squamosa TaxID=30214 RepID=A0ABD2BG45_VESSQ